MKKHKVREIKYIAHVPTTNKWQDWNPDGPLPRIRAQALAHLLCCPSGEVSAGGTTLWRVLSINLDEALWGTLGNGFFKKFSHIRNMGHINLLKSKNQSIKNPAPSSPQLSCRHFPRENLITTPHCMERTLHSPCCPLKQAPYSLRGYRCSSTALHYSDDLTWRLKCRSKAHWMFNIVYDITI